MKMKRAEEEEKEEEEEGRKEASLHVKVFLLLSSLGSLEAPRCSGRRKRRKRRRWRSEGGKQRAKEG